MIAVDIIWWPQQASTTAVRVDHLLYFLLGVTGAVGLLVAVLMIGFAVIYRRRPDAVQPPRVKNFIPLELFWSVTPLAIFIVFFVWGATIYYDAYRPPDNAMVVYGIGKQWMWKFQHPEGQREINELHVPIGQPVQVVLTSEDVIHSFFVPDFRIHMDVLPNRYTSVWFQATRIGSWRLECSQYCGTNHSGMIGRVIVMTRANYENWLHSHAEGSMALQGRKVFLKYRCISCHAGQPHEKAPLLEEIWNQTVHFNNGQTAIVDAAYIRRSILNPSAQVVEGWQDIMPSFKGQIREEEILEVIAFIRSLHRGGTPPRVEESPPPVKQTVPVQSRRQKS
jgi:cytochrome c oxidase subunit II